MIEQPEPDLAARLSVVSGRLARALRTAKGGLSHGLLSALASVAKHGPIRLADLAQIEQVSAPSITRVVADLQAQALVSRKPDPEDGRAVLIEVTEEGQDALVLARLARQQILAQLLLQLDPAERHALEAVMPSLERLVESDLLLPRPQLKQTGVS